jgi:ABC-type bacteriocin/lantibiotic exporter with double-glycine peptidase domain
MLTAALINSAVENDFNRFFAFCALAVILFAASQVMDCISDICEEDCYSNAYENLIKLLDRKIRKQDFTAGSISDSWINQLMGQDFEKANKYFCVEKIKLVFYVMSAISIIVIMFVYSWQIAMAVTILVSVSVLLNKNFGRTITEKSEASLKEMEELKSIVIDQMKLSKEDRFQAEKQISEQLYISHIKRFKEKFKSKNIAESAYLNLVSYGSLNGVILITIIMSAYYLMEGKIGVGTLYLFQSYASQLWNPGEFIMGFRTKYKENRPIFNRVEKLEEIPEIDDYKEDKINSVSLENYIGLSNENKPLHNAINQIFSLNHVYLIVGENGAGKTTAIENMLQLTKRYTGEIKYNDGNDMCDDFTYIPSKPYVSKYYDENHVNVSDGQKKLYQLRKDTEHANTVVIFDEPTNFLDRDKKKTVVEIIEKLKQDHIIIVVSHDPYILQQNYSKLEIAK